MSLLSKLKSRIFKGNRHFLHEFVASYDFPLDKVGSTYGGWVIPSNVLNQKSICYLAGAGEDISFDVFLAKENKCGIYIYDPTPRAKNHFDELVKKARCHEKMPINKSNTSFYDIDIDSLNRLHFFEVGLWSRKDELKFYAPQNPQHVSHSILNLQKTQSFFTAQVERLSSLMKDNGHTKIDLLKLDIEGAEYEVLDSVIEDKLDIGIICVEFDELNNPIDKEYKTRVKKAINRLIASGYQLVNIDGDANFTFWKKNSTL